MMEVIAIVLLVALFYVSCELIQAKRDLKITERAVMESLDKMLIVTDNIDMRRKEAEYA